LEEQKNITNIYISIKDKRWFQLHLTLLLLLFSRRHPLFILAGGEIEREMKASLKGRYEYETDKTAATSATSTVVIPAGDFKLRASMTDATFVKGPSLNGLSLAVEKPGCFIFDYNVPKNVILHLCFVFDSGFSFW